uniref:ARAD1D15466p n=1 Tax=Blastobotrys adeninivorans TaxID=409370 RepID=A0A060T9I4_BLAAD
MLAFGQMRSLAGFLVMPLRPTASLLVRSVATPHVAAVGFGRGFGTTQHCQLKAHKLPPRPTISEDEIEEVFIKGGGKGGQKINKTNSKVQLRHIPTGIVVSCQYSRSREQNRKRAREILAGKVDEELSPPGQSRAAIVAKYYQNKARKKKARSKKKYAELAKNSTEEDAENSGEQDSEPNEANKSNNPEADEDPKTNNTVEKEGHTENGPNSGQ